MRGLGWWLLGGGFLKYALWVFGGWSWWEVDFVSDVWGIRAVTFDVVTPWFSMLGQWEGWRFA